MSIDTWCYFFNVCSATDNWRQFKPCVLYNLKKISCKCFLPVSYSMHRLQKTIIILVFRSQNSFQSIGTFSPSLHFQHCQKCFVSEVFLWYKHWPDFSIYPVYWIDKYCMKVYCQFWFSVHLCAHIAILTTECTTNTCFDVEQQIFTLATLLMIRSGVLSEQKFLLCLVDFLVAY